MRDLANLIHVCCEKKAELDPDAFEKFCDDHLEKWYDSVHSWNKHNPSTHAPYIHGMYLTLSGKFKKWSKILASVLKTCEYNVRSSKKNLGSFGGSLEEL